MVPEFLGIDKPAIFFFLFGGGAGWGGGDYCYHVGSLGSYLHVTFPLDSITYLFLPGMGLLLTTDVAAPFDYQRLVRAAVSIF